MRAACGAHRAAAYGHRVSVFARLADALARRRVATRHLAARANDVGTARTFRTPHGRAMGSPDSGDGRATTPLEGPRVPRSAVAARAASTGPASGERGTRRSSGANASPSSGLDESHDAKTEEKKALKIPLDPALAVASMLALEAEGDRFTLTPVRDGLTGEWSSGFKPPRTSEAPEETVDARGRGTYTGKITLFLDVHGCDVRNVVVSELKAVVVAA